MAEVTGDAEAAGAQARQQFARARRMRRRAQKELGHARVLHVCATRIRRQAQVELGRARALRRRQQVELRRAGVLSNTGRSWPRLSAPSPSASEAAGDDHGTDSDNIRYVPDSLADDTIVPDSFEDEEEEARIAAHLAAEAEKDEKVLAIVRPMMFKIIFPNFPELHK